MTGASGIDGPIAIVGGAGFIGSNLAESFLLDGREVVVVDTLCRPGVEANLAWLKARFGDRIRHAATDVRDADGLASVLAPAGAVFHLAAQVAVTTSLDNPRADFDVNAAGTLNVLEAVRRAGARAPVIFASTNKVYGGLEDLDMTAEGDRHVPADPTLRDRGVPETRGLDFCTPYGCSKGVADQYVLDYAKSFGLRTAVLRMSCIYGPRQFGTEDQGWVAHFLIKAMKGEPITIFGDGRQVRDVLHVRDAVAAYRTLLDRIDEVSGTAFNLGGGPRNAVSLKEVLGEIRSITGRDVALGHERWRTGDQLWFVADTGLLEKTVGWTQTIGWREGLRDLGAWLRESGPASVRTAPSEPQSELRRVMA
ncbi:NAD-dependent epimerase/dehydratase family protein [Chthonobacter rhizosphaerae]|uniref:NAD-dependent epimerase/dehydratase family protein n=1 Tax=Chthonobacter rhizosphaerae TaxID=2735553 RepID=UPI0015EFC7B9|nr:NAD-dependent epimerase/dehydratase family protein [Chthonobacter rhizosphaerae]